MAIDPKLKKALKEKDLAAAQARWHAMTERQRPSTTETSSLLWVSATVINPEIAQWLVDEGADPHYYQRNAQHMILDVASRAILQGNLELVQWLVTEKGLDVNRQTVPDGPTPIEEALTAKQPLVASWLKEQGADLNHQDMLGNTIFHKAATHLNLEALVWLMENGADPLVENHLREIAEQYIPENGPTIPPPYNADEVFETLSAYTHAFKADPQVEFQVPESLLDQRAVERVGLLFMDVPKAEWTEDHRRSSLRHQGQESTGPLKSSGVLHKPLGF